MDYVPMAEKGVASGVATLDPKSKIPSIQLPDLSATYARNVAAPTGDAATDTVVLQSAIDAAATAGGGIVRLQGGTYVSGGLLIKSGVHLIGTGVGGTTIRLKNAATSHLIDVPNFASLTGTNVTGGENGWGISDLTLDGNAGGQTNMALLTMRVYGCGYRMTRVEIKGSSAGACLSEWGNNSGGNMEAVWSDFKITDNWGVGLDWRGPHDSAFNNGYVVSGPYGHYGTTGIHVRGNSGGEMWNHIHVWGYHGNGWIFEHSGQAINCQSEGATGANIRVLVDAVSWEGIVYGTNDYHTNETGIELGSATVNVQRVNLNVRVHNFGATSVPIKITGSNGRNVIRGTVLRGNAAFVLGGKQNVLDKYEVWCVDYPGQSVQNSPHPQLTQYNGANAWVLRHINRSFINGNTSNQDAQRLQFAYNSGLQFYSDVFSTQMGPDLTGAEWASLTANRTPGEETMTRSSANSNVQMTSGRLTLTFFTARSATSAANVTLATADRAAASIPTLARIGLYLVNADNTLTLVASTVNDTSLFSATFTQYTRAFSSPVYTLTPGQRYAIGIIIVSGASLPTFAGAGPNVEGLSLAPPRIAGYLAGKSDLPPSVPTTLTGGASMVYAAIG
ncbi:hypothetical protein [Arthrobacter sp. HS15c]|uniref:hypothetical protein n=1 Tax=Arthrobacter sp. HS15c TaxID=3230279 RepID=UPI00346680F0